MHRFADGHREVTHEAIAPRLGQGDVEIGVQFVEGVLVARVGHAIQNLLRPDQRLWATLACGSSAGGALQGDAGLGEVGERHEGEGQLQPQNSSDGVGRGRLHPGAVAPPGLRDEDAQGLQHPYRLTHRPAAHTQLRGEVTFTGKLVTIGESS